MRFGSRGKSTLKVNILLTFWLGVGHIPDIVKLFRSIAVFAHWNPDRCRGPLYLRYDAGLAGRRAWKSERPSDRQPIFRKHGRPSNQTSHLNRIVQSLIKLTLKLVPHSWFMSPLLSDCVWEVAIPKSTDYL